MNGKILQQSYQQFIMNKNVDKNLKIIKKQIKKDKKLYTLWKEYNFNDECLEDIMFELGWSKGHLPICPTCGRLQQYLMRSDNTGNGISEVLLCKKCNIRK
jgi:hypothetical protein